MLTPALTPDSLKKIDRELAKYPADQRQSAIMAGLQIAQEEKGWLAPETIEEVARYIGIEPIAAYEVASFYNMYDLKPVGKYKLTVCTNLPCMLSGGVDAGEYLKQKLGIGYDETTPDGKFTLKQGECMGACGDAPVMIVNNRKMCSWMNPEQIDKLLAELE
ncbi:MAG: NADH-quinone oxidoreductase subunit NuoE [Azospira sp.]|jgi:NADH-quinone oxidoreductase subunit E|nr:NADH-quinone oxidoreductase subunit NuoE [Azospira sp.]